MRTIIILLGISAAFAQAPSTPPGPSSLPGVSGDGASGLKVRGSVTAGVSSACPGGAPAGSVCAVKVYGDGSALTGIVAGGGGDMVAATYVTSGAGTPSSPCATAGAQYRNTSTTPYNFYYCPSAGGTWLGPVLFGSIFPNTAPSAGQILAGNAGGTAYAPVTMSGDCTLASTGVITCAPAYSTASSAVTTNIGAVTMLTTSALHSYDLSWTISLTTVGTSCTGSTTVTLNAIFTDPNTSSPTTLPLGTVTLAANGNGTAGFIASGVDHILAKSGTAVQYSTSGYTLGTGCSPGPAYQVSPVLAQKI